MKISLFQSLGLLILASATTSCVAQTSAPRVKPSGSTLFQTDFEDGNVWMALKPSAVGTIDAAGSSQPSQGLAYKNAIASGPLAIKNSETNLGKLTLAFSLAAQAATPVTVRVESFDKNKKRTGGLETQIFPPAPDFYQRFALDLDKMKPSGTGKFAPNAPFVGFSFQADGAKIHLDNVQFARPAFYVSEKGSDKNDGRTEQTAFATPQKAVDMAGPGDIIDVMNGTYKPVGVQEGIARFKKTGAPAAWISLKNYPGQTPLFNSKGSWGAVRIWYPDAQFAADQAAGVVAPVPAYIEVRGLHIRGNGDTAKAQYPDLKGWAFVAPGNPQLAEELARKAASVSHDGEAIYGAQVIAVMVAQAFVESDLNALLDLALTFIPAESEIARCICDVRAWHAATPDDWRATRLKIVEKYGYERYGTNCPIVSNHAIVILGLLYGDDDFGKSLQITCNAAYDTDCNAANVGAILGIKNGLAGIDAGNYDWRGPVADRLYLPTAESGNCFSDALTRSEKLVNQGRVLAGLEPQFPKNGARFHFSQPGSVQGFTSEDDALEISNIERDGERGLRLCAKSNAPVSEATVETFRVSGAGGGYGLVGNPSIFSGQNLRAEIRAETAVEVAFVLYRYDANDEIRAETGLFQKLDASQSATLEWRVPDFDGQPIARVGLQWRGAQKGDALWLSSLTWDGEPNAIFHQPQAGGTVWKRAWVDAVDTRIFFDKSFNVIAQNRGRGLISTGTNDWKNYRADARFKLRAARGGGLAVRYGGLERYYGLMLQTLGKLVLFKRRDGVETVLGEIDFSWEYEPLYDLFLSCDGAHLTAGIGDEVLLLATDENLPLTSGGIALLIEEGCLMESARVTPLGQK